jgi:hypothetical protein
MYVRENGPPRAGRGRDSRGVGRGGMLLESAPAPTGTGCLCATAASAAASDAACSRLTGTTGNPVLGLARHWRRSNLCRGGASPEIFATDEHGCTRMPDRIIRVDLWFIHMARYRGRGCSASRGTPLKHQSSLTEMPFRSSRDAGYFFITSASWPGTTISMRPSASFASLS